MAAERAVVEAWAAAHSTQVMAVESSDFWKVRAETSGRLADAYDALREALRPEESAFRYVLIDAYTERRADQSRALRHAEIEAAEAADAGEVPR